MRRRLTTLSPHMAQFGPSNTASRSGVEDAVTTEARLLDGDWDDPDRGWTADATRTLLQWKEKARGSYIIYTRASEHYATLFTRLDLAMKVCTAFAGVAGFAAAVDSTTDKPWHERLMNVVSATLPIMVAILSHALTSSVKPEMKREKFHAAASAFHAISGRLGLEADRPRRRRTAHFELMSSVQAEINRVHRDTPTLPIRFVKAAADLGPVHSPAFQGSGAPQRRAAYMPDIMIPVGAHVTQRQSSAEAGTGRPSFAPGVQVIRGATYDPDADVEAGVVTDGSVGNGSSAQSVHSRSPLPPSPPLPPLPPSSGSGGGSTTSPPQPPPPPIMVARLPEDATLF